MKAKKERYFQVTAKAMSICGWTLRAANLGEARMLANGGPDWNNLDFDQPDGFKIVEIVEKD